MIATAMRGVRSSSSRLRALGLSGAWRGRFRDVEEQEQQRSDDVDRDDGQIGAEERHHHRIGGQLDQLRADHGRDQPARHDIGNRLGAELLGCGVDGGKAVKALRRHVDAGEKRAEQEDRKAAGTEAHRRRSRPPRLPPAAPMKNPALRPKRCIRADTGVADSIEPSTISEIGSVAKQIFEASDCPARPPTTKIIGICAPRNACARTRISTLRFARVSVWGRLASVMPYRPTCRSPGRKASKRRSQTVSMTWAKEPQTRPSNRPIGGRALPSASSASNSGAPSAFSVVA